MVPRVHTMRMRRRISILETDAGGGIGLAMASHNGEPHDGEAKYACDLCNCRFSRKKNYLQHLAGRQHLTNDAASSATYQRYLNRPGASKGTSADSCDVVRAWSSDELSMLPMRATCLSPSTILGQLSEYERARVWKYVSEVRRESGFRVRQRHKEERE
jgi:uncharacterized C2H2 Zn-finger protein